MKKILNEVGMPNEVRTLNKVKILNKARIVDKIEIEIGIKVLHRIELWSFALVRSKCAQFIPCLQQTRHDACLRSDPSHI